MNAIRYLVVLCSSCLLAAVGIYAADAAKEGMIARIQQADEDAILEAGKSRDSSYIPALQEQAGGRATDRRIIAAKMALARLGVKKYLDETVAELTATNSALFEAYKENERGMGASEVMAAKFAKYRTQEQAFEKLAYIRNPSTVKIVAQFLYSTEHYQFSADVPPWWASSAAARALQQMVDNPPALPAVRTGEEENRIWQQWWEQNKDKYP